MSRVSVSGVSAFTPDACGPSRCPAPPTPAAPHVARIRACHATPAKTFGAVHVPQGLRAKAAAAAAAAALTELESFVHVAKNNRRRRRAGMRPCRRPRGKGRVFGVCMRVLCCVCAWVCVRACGERSCGRA